MIRDIKDTTTLNNGVKMPWLGLGVYKVDPGIEVQNSVKHALEAGYRSIDTASYYKNEEGVGKAIKEAGIPREELFITTKVWNSDQGYDSTLKAFEESRKKLGLDYLDLYLIHWPVKDKYLETWKALVKLYQEGHVRAIGVSNFNINHLQDLLRESDIIPAVNQVEFHPLLTQKELLNFCRANKIQLEAWSPLIHGNLGMPLLTDLSEKYIKTKAQIVLRWDLQHEVVTIPKTITPYRIQENTNIFDFELSREDMERIDALNENKRTGPDPENVNF